jgi:hypothetical protein
VRKLTSPEVAARLDPKKCYGIWWFNRRRSTRKQVAEYGPNGRSYRRRYKVVLKPRKEWIAVPVPDTGIRRELVDAAREATKDNRRPSAAGTRFWELSGGVLVCSGCGCRMMAHRRRKNPKSPYYHYYRCPTRHNRGKDACPQVNSYRAEEIEGRVWSFVSDYLKDPERLRAGLRRMIVEAHQAMRGDPEREAKAWLEKIAETDRQRTRVQDLAIEGLLGPDELRDKLTHLTEQRKTAERELEALRTQTERLANLELEADTLLEHYTRIAPEGLDCYTPEDRHQAYKELRMRMLVHPDGSMEANGIFNLNGAPVLCINERAPRFARSPSLPDSFWPPATPRGTAPARGPLPPDARPSSGRPTSTRPGCDGRRAPRTPRRPHSQRGVSNPRPPEKGMVASCPPQADSTATRNPWITHGGRPLSWWMLRFLVSGGPGLPKSFTGT